MEYIASRSAKGECEGGCAPSEVKKIVKCVRQMERFGAYFGVNFLLIPLLYFHFQRKLLELNGAGESLNLGNMLPEKLRNYENMNSEAFEA